MPKIKTHQGAAKRISITKGGKLKRRHAFVGHKLEKRSSARKRSYRNDPDVATSTQSRLRKLLNV